MRCRTAMLFAILYFSCIDVFFWEPKKLPLIFTLSTSNVSLFLSTAEYQIRRVHKRQAHYPLVFRKRCRAKLGHNSSSDFFLLWPTHFIRYYQNYRDYLDAAHEQDVSEFKWDYFSLQYWTKENKNFIINHQKTSMQVRKRAQSVT